MEGYVHIIKCRNKCGVNCKENTFTLHDVKVFKFEVFDFFLAWFRFAIRLLKVILSTVMQHLVLPLCLQKKTNNTIWIIAVIIEYLNNRLDEYLFAKTQDSLEAIDLFVRYPIIELMSVG